MIKKFTEFLLAKDANASAIAFLCALLPVFRIPVGFFAVIIVGLVTLQKGALSGLKVLAWTALPALAMLALREFGLFDLLLFRCVLIWMLACLFRRTNSWRFLLTSLALLGVLCVIVLHMILPNIDQWWTAHLAQYLKELIPSNNLKTPDMPAAFATRIAPMATGISGFFFVCGVMVELMMARACQSIAVNPGEFRREFEQIRLTRVALYVLALLLVLCALKWKPAIDAVPLALVPFFFAGLSVLHFAARQKRSLALVLFAFYVVLFFVPAIVVFVLAMIAMIDVWVNFRKRLFNVKVGVVK